MCPGVARLCAGMFFTTAARRKWARPNSLGCDVVVFVEADKVPLQHGNGHLADARAECPHRTHSLRVKIAPGREVDAEHAWLEAVSGHLEFGRGHARYYHVGGEQRVVALDVRLQYFDRARNLAGLVDHDSGHVDRVHERAVVGKHGGEWPPNDLGAVDDGYNFAGQLLTGWERALVNASVLDNFDARERRARQDGLLARLDEALVVVERVPVAVVHALNVLLDRDDVLDVVVHLPPENRVVDQDAVHRVVLVRRDHRLLEVEPRALAQLVRDTDALARFPRPVGVHARLLVVVGEQADQLGPRALQDRCLDLRVKALRNRGRVEDHRALQPVTL
mmetsp:Transcript_13380/g.34082  ORF Transcript_13380/g.34082 Transcript_13380/m.34082 type:complete len:335 (+) Transcript_13380:131-1135(+)